MSDSVKHEQAFAASLLRLSRAITRAMRRVATRHIVDFLGVAIAGVNTPSVDTVRALFTASTAKEGGRVLGTDTYLSISDAVLINAMAGHIHDFDDDETLLSIAHVTVPVTAAAWTWGECIGACGERIVAAYVTGVEAMMRIGQIVNPVHYRRGWHSSTTLGGLGAATAIAVLSGFDEAQLLHALRFAASMSWGIRKSFGSDAKSIQLGRSVANGFLAAQLAQAEVQYALLRGGGGTFRPHGYRRILGCGDTRERRANHARAHRSADRSRHAASCRRSRGSCARRHPHEQWCYPRALSRAHARQRAAADPKPVLQQKYLDCATPVIGAQRAVASYEALRDLSSLSDVSDVFTLRTATI